MIHCLHCNQDIKEEEYKEHWLQNKEAIMDADVSEDLRDMADRVLFHAGRYLVELGRISGRQIALQALARRLFDHANSIQILPQQK